MRGIDERAARITWTVFLIILAIGIIYAIRNTIFIFIVALFFAYMLSPLVDIVNRLTPRSASRTLALAIVYLLLVGGLIGFGILLGGRIAEEASSFANRLPELTAAGPSENWHIPPWLESLRVKLIGAIRSQFEFGVEQAMPVFRQLGEQILGIIGHLGFVVLIPILGFFFLKDGPRLKRSMLALFGEGDHRLLAEGIFSGRSTCGLRTSTTRKSYAQGRCRIFRAATGMPCARNSFHPADNPGNGVVTSIAAQYASAHRSTIRAMIHKTFRVACDNRGCPAVFTLADRMSTIGGLKNAARQAGWSISEAGHFCQKHRA